MRKIVASVKLVPGCRGFFDPVTGINLSLSNSIGYIREDDKVDNIRKAVREGKIKIVGGQLPPAINIKPIQKAKKIIKKVEEIKPVEVKEEPKKLKKQKRVKPAEIKKEQEIIVELKPIEEKEDKPVEAGE